MVFVRRALGLVQTIFFSSDFTLRSHAKMREKKDFTFEVFSFSAICFSPLLCFLVQSVLAAETAVLVHLKSVGIIFLVFLSVIIPLLAFAACESDLYSHCSVPPVYSDIVREFGDKVASTFLRGILRPSDKAQKKNPQSEVVIL